MLAHGKDEHIGRYAELTAALVGAGYTVYAQDHRGHGKSGGPRGVIRRFDDYVDDLDLLVERARSEADGRPLFLLGHSMGGLIAARYALGHQATLSGLILTSAAFVIGEDVPAWKKQLLLVLSRLFPNRPLSSGLGDVNYLSRDLEVQRLFGEDPLCNNEPTRLGFVRVLYLAAQATVPATRSLTLPLLLMHGAADRLTSPRGTEAVYALAASPDKTLKLWPDDLHELFNELDRAEIIAFTLEWLKTRSAVD